MRRLLEAVKLPGGHWLDPCAGDGAIIRAANQVRIDTHWSAIELRDELDSLARLVPAASVACPVDFIEWSPSYENGYPDVILTNPPYSLAREFVDWSLRLAEHVVMLLRLNFIASAERRDFMAATHPNVYVLPNRPSFATSFRCVDEGGCGSHFTLGPRAKLPVCPDCGGSTSKSSSDATEYAWFHWHQDNAGIIRVLATTPADERARDAEAGSTPAPVAEPPRKRKAGRNG